MIACVAGGRIGAAEERLQALWVQGYGANDIVNTLFKMLKSSDIAEPLKLEMLKV
jgi:hypothetical protein